MNVHKRLVFLFVFGFLITAPPAVHANSVKKSAKATKDTSTVKMKAIKADIISNLEKVHAYDQAIGLLKEKEPMDIADLKVYRRLLDYRERTKYSLDSLKLIIAEKYRKADADEKAETQLSALTASEYPDIRRSATASLDSLIKDGKVSVIKKYFFDPWMKVLEPVFPFGFALLLLLFVFLICNKLRNGRQFAVICNDEEEGSAFRTAVKNVLDELNSSMSQDEDDASIMAPGPGNVMPHLESDTPSELQQVITTSLPEGYQKIVGFIWKAGSSPRNQLIIMIEKTDTDAFIRAHLKIGRTIVKEWNETVSKSNLFDKRLDIVYESLIQIQIFSGNQQSNS